VQENRSRPIKSLRRRGFLAAAILLVPAILGLAGVAAAAAPAPLPWWKGNVHLHSRWSDGADFPEVVAAWYKDRGYHFIAVTDHNRLQEGEYWSALARQPRDNERLEQYRKWLGGAAVQTREQPDPKTGKPVVAVRLTPLADYRAKFEQPGRFIIIPGEEITDAAGKSAVHSGALGLAEVIPPLKPATVQEAIQGHIRAVRDQAERLKQPMLAILNHPNFRAGVPVEDLQAVPDLEFVEIMNSLPSDVENTGDENLLSHERIWDAALAWRLSQPGFGVIYGLATDDSHDLAARSGGGWIMVRAKSLTPQALFAAMKAGDFYSTTGVRLNDARRTPRELAVEVDPEPGVTYTIQFIGTLAGYDRSREQDKDEKGKLLPPTKRYSPDIGKVLREVAGTKAAYQAAGNELYVRARIVSSKPKKDPDVPGFFETAWTQPLAISRPAPAASN